MPKMSGQRSGWRERLHANPSRMEEELAIKLQDNQIRYLTQVEIPVTSRPLLPTITPTVASVCRRQGPSWNGTDDEGRRTTHTTTQERIQNPRTVLLELLRQEEGSVVRGHPEQS